MTTPGSEEKLNLAIVGSELAIACAQRDAYRRWGGTLWRLWRAVAANLTDVGATAAAMPFLTLQIVVDEVGKLGVVVPGVSGTPPQCALWRAERKRGDAWRELAFARGELGEEILAGRPGTRAQMRIFDALRELRALGEEPGADL